MEQWQKQRIASLYPETSAAPTIGCLEIPDQYLYMEPELQARIRKSFEEWLNRYQAVKMFSNSRM